MLHDEWNAAIPEGYAHTQTHIFSNGESDAERERERWLEQQLTNAELTRTELFCKKTPEGYKFGFKNFKHYAAFRLNAYGDPPSLRGHVCTQEFDKPLDPVWVLAAEAHLQSLGLEYGLDVSEHSASFGFDRFSEVVALRGLIDAGEIERFANVLHRTQSFFTRVRKQGPPPPLNLPPEIV